MANQLGGILDALFLLSKEAKKLGMFDLCEDVLSVVQAYDTRDDLKEKYDALAADIFELNK